MRIYISGPLKAVSNREDAHRFYERLAKMCEECGYEPYLPHQNSDPVIHNHLSYKDVFELDYGNLIESSKIIAVITEPSTGVGAEIGIALENNIEVIAVYNEKSDPSRFVLGLLENSPLAKIIRFKSEDECISKLRNTLQKNSDNKILQKTIS